MQFNEVLFFEKCSNPTFLESIQSVSTDDLANVFDLTRQQLEEHIGENATYTHKTILKKYLSIIHNKLSNDKISLDEKIAIKEKIKEGAEACAMGLMNRAQDIVRGMIEPKNVSELLAFYRADIINKLRADSEETHDHQQFYDIANQMNKALPLAGVEDTVKGKALSEEEIRFRIESAFTVHYKPAKIVESLLESSFAKLGYVGRHYEGYEYNVYAKIFDFFKDAMDVRALSYTDLFLLNNDNKIIDINWIEIISQLIVYFEDHGYLTFDNHIAVNHKHAPTLMLKIDANDPMHSLLTIKIGEAEKTIFFGNVAYLKENRKISSALIKLVSSKSIEKSVRQYLRVLLFLSGFDVSVKEPILEAVLPHLVQDSYQLGIVLPQLSPSQCTIVCEVIKKTQPNVICGIDELARLLQKLNLKQIKAVCTVFRRMLGFIILNDNLFGRLLKNLSPQQITTVCVLLKEKLRYKIDAAHHLGRLLQHLNPKQINAVCKFYDGIIKNLSMLRGVLEKMKRCTQEQRIAVFCAYKRSLPAFVCSIEDIKFVFKELDAAHIQEFSLLLKEVILNAITTGFELADVLNNLEEKQQKDFCMANTETVLYVICDAERLTNLLQCLDEKRISIFCEPLRKIIPKTVNCENTLARLLTSLETKKYVAFCKANENTLLDGIDNGIKLQKLLQCLNAEQITVVCESHKKSMLRLITNQHEYRTVIQDLNAQQCQAFCAANETVLLCIVRKDILPTLMSNQAYSAEPFEELLRNLDLDQRYVVCGMLQTIILNEKDVPQNIKTYVESVVTWLYEARQLWEVMSHLDAQEQEEVFESSPEELPNMLLQVPSSNRRSKSPNKNTSGRRFNANSVGFFKGPHCQSLAGQSNQGTSCSISHSIR